MGKVSRWLFCLIVIVMMTIPVTLWAKDKAKIAVLPFAVHSSENIDYVQQGIWDMLSSRISSNEKLAVSSKESVLEAVNALKKKDLSQADVYGIGKSLNVDYAVWGSVTKIGNSLSIDGKLIDISTNKTPVSIFTQSQGMDDVITKINDFAKRIDQFAMGGGTAEASTAAGGTKAAAPETKESQIVAGMRSGRRGTLTGTINPDFIRGGLPGDKKGSWMSQRYPTEYRGLDVGDVNGDGLNEIVTIDSNSVYIFQKKGKDMTLLTKISGKNYEKYVGVDVFNLTGGNAKDIIVSNVYSVSTTDKAFNNIQSFILSWRDGKFVKVADNLPWLFRVINNSGTQRLLGQQLSVGASMSMGGSLIFQTPIHEMIWRDGKVEEGRKMRVPNGIGVYGLAIDNMGEGRDKIITFNEYDHLVVFEETEKDLLKISSIMGGKEMIFKSDDVFGGSNIFIPVYSDTGAGADFGVFHKFLSPRILTYDVDKKGTRELFIAKNDAPTGRIFENIRIFSSTEFFNLHWDSLGLTENWHTKKMGGYAVDYQIKDIDNDGEDDIIIALVTSSGSLAGKSSVIVSYKMRAE